MNYTVYSRPPYKNRCFVCGKAVDSIVVRQCKDSKEFSGDILCPYCQKEYHNVYYDHNYPVHAYAMRLRRELYKLGIKSDLEKPVFAGNGDIHIDLAIPSAHLNIEIDGIEHNQDCNIAINDLTRTIKSLEMDYYTIRIPNSIFEAGDEYIQRAAELIADVADYYERQYR